MKNFLNINFILLIYFFFTSIFTLHAHSKYEDPTLERLNHTYQFEKSIQVARFKLLKANSNEEKLFYNNCIIRAYSKMGNNDSSLIYVKYSLDMLPSIHDSELICETYYRLGLAYKLNLDINNGTNYLLKAAILAEKINYTFIKVEAYIHLGNLIENENQNLNLALYYINLAIKSTDDNKFDKNNSDFLKDKINALINRAAILVRLGKIKESLNDLFMAKALINNNLYSEKEIVLIYLNKRFSVTYAMINDSKNSEKYIDEALKISKSINNITHIIECYRIMANNSFLFKDYYKAIFYGVKADNYDNKNSGELAGKIYIDSLLFLSYKNIGDQENALKYFEKFVDLKNKYYEKNRINELNKLDIKFQLEENEKKLALKNLEQTKNKATIQFLILFIIITIILILVVIGYKYLENKRKKLIFKNIENSDKEINSIKGWQNWRNNSKILVNNDTSVPIAEVGDSLNNSPEVMIDQAAPGDSEITLGAIGENNIDVEVNKENYTNLYFELRELLETKQLYLNPNLILEDLIKELGTNKKYLYYAIKSNYDDNFKSLLSDYRVNHVKSLIVESIKTKKKIHMEEIQESSGFQSTASFFRVFKSKTGLTPSEYAEQVKLTNLSTNKSIPEAIAV
jgi:AraC-like DNA-binding protein